MSSADLDYFVKEIQNCGVKKINGSIIFDNSYFKKTEAILSQTKFLSPLRLPSISPISINKNIIEVVINSQGSAVKVQSFPASRYITINNKITLSSGSNNAGALLEERANGFNIVLKGNITPLKEEKIYLFVKKPELLTALLLKEKFENSGIKLTGFPQQGILAADATVKITSSIKIISLLKEINKNSNNFFAETVKRIFDEYYTKQTKESNTLKSFLISAGIDTDNCIFADGSGISAKNIITANSLAGILTLLYKEKNNFEIFRSSLSVAGVDGTLKVEYADSPVKNNFWGKTGYLNGISSICGYMRSTNGRNIIIAILINYKIKDIDFYRRVEKKIIETIFKLN